MFEGDAWGMTAAFGGRTGAADCVATGKDVAAAWSVPLARGTAAAAVAATAAHTVAFRPPEDRQRAAMVGAEEAADPTCAAAGLDTHKDHPAAVECLRPGLDSNVGA